MRTNHKTTAMLAALERAELYFAAYPGSPSAVRHPALSQCAAKWVATLGTGRRSIVGVGLTVEDALRESDRQYLAYLRPPSDAIYRRPSVPINVRTERR